MIELTSAQISILMSTSVKKTWTFEVYNGDTLEGSIPTSKMVSGGFSINEPLCTSSPLEIGACESSVLKIKLADIDEYELKGRTLKLTLTAADDETAVSFDMGAFTVDSSESKNSGYYYSVVAYDGMSAFDADVSDWYNGLYESATSYTIKQLRTSLCAFFGVEQESVTLPNDSVKVEQTITASSLTGRDVLKAICQINGCFGHFNRSGKLGYVYLGDSAVLTLTKGGESHYKTSATHEDWTVKAYDCVQIIPDEVTSDADSAGGVYPAAGGENGLVISDNFLTYGMSDSKLTAIAQNIYKKVCNQPYVVHSTPTRGRPWIEIGDKINIEVEKDGVTSTIETYVLERTMSEYQSIMDTYAANGTEDSTDNTVSSNTQITQLKGKTNVLTRTVEKMSSEITDLDESLSSKIEQTAENISAELNNYATKASLSIYVTAESLETTLTSYATDEDLYNELKSYVTADSLKTTLSSYTTDDDLANELESYVTSSSLEVTISEYATKNGENETKTFSYSLTADGFKLTANGTNVFVCDETGVTVNGTIYADSGTIGGLTISEDSITSSNGNFSVTSEGVLEATGATISGEITTESGTIGGFTITDSSLYNGQTAYDSESSAGVYIGTDGIGLGGGSFFVSADGQLYADSATIVGEIVATSGTIGGLTISENSISSSNNNFSVSSEGVLEATGAIISGEITADSGTIGGLTISEDSITSSNGNFSVTSEGVLEATGATISGEITTESGTIGGFTITDSALYSEQDSYYGDGSAGVYIGTDGIGLGDGTFYITNAGKLYAGSATITGNITATSGKIGEFNITYVNSTGQTTTSTASDAITALYVSGAVAFSKEYLKFYDGASNNMSYIHLNCDGLEYTKYPDNLSSYPRLKGTYSNSGIEQYYYTDSSTIKSYLKMYIDSDDEYYRTKIASQQNIDFSAAGFTFSSDIWPSITAAQCGTTDNPWYKITAATVEATNATIGDYFTVTNGASALSEDGYYNNTLYAAPTCFNVSKNTILLRAVSAGYLKGTWYLNSNEITTSDRNAKKDIELLSGEYNTLFDNLSPVRFKYNDGTSNRYHTGFIAQDVKEAIENAGLTTDDAAMYVEQTDEDGAVTCGLRYSEIIALCVKEIQELKKEIEELKAAPANKD